MSVWKMNVEIWFIWLEEGLIKLNEMGTLHYKITQDVFRFLTVH